MGFPLSKIFDSGIGICVRGQIDWGGTRGVFAFCFAFAKIFGAKLPIVSWRFLGATNDAYTNFAKLDCILHP